MTAEGAPKAVVAEPKQIPVDQSAVPNSSESPNAAAEAISKGEEKAPVRVIKPLTPGCKRPVMIHRAVIGSVERFSGILMEHFAGKWPFWISPRQIMVIPVGVGYNDYANQVKEIFHEQGMFVDVDVSGNTLKDKIRTAQVERYNFTFVVGEVEMTKREVNIRNRDDTSSQDRGKPVSIQEAIDKLVTLRKSRAEGNPFAVTPEERKAELLKQVEEAKVALEAREKALAELE